ncbi:MAG: ATP-binding cassette domain-containing protein [Flavobacteriaceae bacterium]
MNIVLENISKKYGAFTALNNVSFSLKKGEIVGLLGPNGAGKSTLMKILTGYYLNWDGKALFDGLDFKKNTSAIQKKTGYLPENNPLYPEMTVAAYLNFTAGLYRLKNPPLVEVVNQTGLEQHLYNKIGTLSKGYRQRVGLAAALLHNPEILILDEPTTGLDPNQLVDIRNLIQNLGKEKTILLSTHILPEVEALCQRVLLLNQGELVLDRSMESLQSTQESLFHVRFDYRVETVALAKIDQVAEARNVHDFEYALTAKNNVDLSTAIFDFAHDNGLKIEKLERRNKSLEALFEEFTKTA